MSQHQHPFGAKNLSLQGSTISTRRDQQKHLEYTSPWGDNDSYVTKSSNTSHVEEMSEFITSPRHDVKKDSKSSRRPSTPPSMTRSDTTSSTSFDTISPTASNYQSRPRQGSQVSHMSKLSASKSSRALDKKDISRPFPSPTKSSALTTPYKPQRAAPSTPSNLRHEPIRSKSVTSADVNTETSFMDWDDETSALAKVKHSFKLGQVKSSWPLKTDKPLTKMKSTDRYENATPRPMPSHSSLHRLENPQTPPPPLPLQILPRTQYQPSSAVQTTSSLPLLSPSHEEQYSPRNIPLPPPRTSPLATQLAFTRTTTSSNEVSPTTATIPLGSQSKPHYTPPLYLPSRRPSQPHTEYSSSRRPSQPHIEYASSPASPTAAGFPANEARDITLSLTPPSTPSSTEYPYTSSDQKQPKKFKSLVSDLVRRASGRDLRKALSNKQ